MKSAWARAIVRAIVGAVAAVVVAAATTAQETPSAWDDAMTRAGAAFESGDLNAAVAALDDAIGSAETPQERGEAYRAAAFVRLQRGQTANALALTERGIEAMAPVESSEDEVDVSILGALWRVRADTLRAVGRNDEWYDAWRASARYYARLPQPGWRVTEDGSTIHILSGFTCPAFIEDMPRERFTTYTTSGGDIGCSYAAGQAAPLLVTTYFTDRGGAPLEAAVDSMKAEVEYAYGQPPVLADDVVNGSTRRVVYAQGDTRLPYAKSAGWLADASGWTAKVRLSWSPPIEDTFTERLAATLINETTANVFLDSCDAVDEEAGERGSGDDSMVDVLGGSFMLMNLSDDFSITDPKGAIYSDGCGLGVIAGASDDFVARRLRAPTGGVSHVAAPLLWREDTPWFAVVSGLGVEAVAANHYVVEYQAGSAAVWTALDGPPADAQFVEIVASIARGEREPLARVEQTDAGATITVRGAPEE